MVSTTHLSHSKSTVDKSKRSNNYSRTVRRKMQYTIEVCSYVTSMHLADPNHPRRCYHSRANRNIMIPICSIRKFAEHAVLG